MAEEGQSGSGTQEREQGHQEQGQLTYKGDAEEIWVEVGW